MSNPLEERAAAYAKEAWITPDPLLVHHLAQFAAAEVARVREMQAKPLRELRRMAEHYPLVADAIRAIDAATRAPRKTRSK